MAFTLPGWNPQERLDRYEDGPGANLPDEFHPNALANANGRPSNGIGIYIRNVRNLNKDGIENLCRKFGRILRIVREDDKSWAIVVFQDLK